VTSPDRAERSARGPGEPLDPGPRSWARVRAEPPPPREPVRRPALDLGQSLDRADSAEPTWSRSCPLAVISGFSSSSRNRAARAGGAGPW